MLNSMRDFVSKNPKKCLVAASFVTGGLFFVAAPIIAPAVGAAGLLGTTATTGTAISALSGAALTNASLAALGGGALTVGGGGMVTGAVAVGGFGFTIPLSVATAKKYKKLIKDK